MGIGCLICDDLLETPAPVPPANSESTVESVKPKKSRAAPKKPILPPKSTDTVVTPCGHLFHELCLFQWFKNKNSTTCPVCRKVCTKGRLVRIFPSLVEDGSTTTSSNIPHTTDLKLSETIKPTPVPKTKLESSGSSTSSSTRSTINKTIPQQNLQTTINTLSSSNASSNVASSQNASGINLSNATNSNNAAWNSCRDQAIQVMQRPGFFHNIIPPLSLNMMSSPANPLPANSRSYTSSLFPNPCSSTNILQPSVPGWAYQYPNYSSSVPTLLPISAPSYQPSANSTLFGGSVPSVTLFQPASTSGITSTRSSTSITSQGYTYLRQPMLFPAPALSVITPMPSNPSNSSILSTQPNSSKAGIPQNNNIDGLSSPSLFPHSNAGGSNGQTTKQLPYPTSSTTVSTSDHSKPSTSCGTKNNSKVVSKFPTNIFVGNERVQDNNSGNGIGNVGSNKYQELKIIHKTLVADYTEMGQKYADLEFENQLLKAQLESSDLEIQKLRKAVANASDNTGSQSSTQKRPFSVQQFVQNHQSTTAGTSTTTTGEPSMKRSSTHNNVPTSSNSSISFPFLTDIRDIIGSSLFNKNNLSPRNFENKTEDSNKNPCSIPKPT